MPQIRDLFLAIPILGIVVYQTLIPEASSCACRRADADAGG
jgi:hypothetical protein